MVRATSVFFIRDILPAALRRGRAGHPRYGYRGYHRTDQPIGNAMQIRQMNWMQVEDYLRHDDRAVLPIGCTEQHAYLSLAVDMILAEKVSADAAEPLGVPVFPVLPFGHTPTFMAYPGTVSLRLETLIAVMRDVLDSLATHGFRRILIVNGHGGNAPVANFLGEWMGDHPDVKVKFHNWW